MSMVGMAALDGLLGVWLLWELMSLFVSDPYDTATGEFLRPPLSLSNWYLRKRVVK